VRCHPTFDKIDALKREIYAAEFALGAMAAPIDAAGTMHEYVRQ
jgi:hypothetical protein